MAMAAAPRPKSPPAPPDPCGRHRLQLAVDALHREIGFLEGEINSIEGIHAASRCCREVDEFIGRTPDPFITISSEKRSHDHSHHFLKKFRCLCRASRAASATSPGSAAAAAPPAAAHPPPPPSTSRGRAAAATATATAAAPPPPHVGRR
uniref:Grain length protein n=1 Tax=Oryza sativa TaxID=4530 RepID=M5AXX5_ORYSA|nr:grain length protein [Oryza sativa]